MGGLACHEIRSSYAESVDARFAHAIIARLASMQEAATHRSAKLCDGGVDNLYESLRLRRCHAMSAQPKQQPKHKQPGSARTVSWSREQAEALRLAAKQ